MSDEYERRDALAKVIDPEVWRVSEDPVVTDKIRDMMRQESRELADRIIESGLMAAYEWDRREYLNARARIIERTSRVGYCENVEDGLDGYFRHDPRCSNWPEGAIGSSVECIKDGSRLWPMARR